MHLSFIPESTLLLGPGPSPVHDSVLAATSQPTIGHLDKQCFALMNEIKQMLQQVFQTRNALTIPLSGPGSAGMEACVANLVEPNEKVVVCINGAFGQRIADSARKVGGNVIEVRTAWGRPITPTALRDTLTQHPDAKSVCFVHGETSTGVLNDAQALCAVAREFGALTIVDAVTSLGGVEVKVDEWGIDAIFSGTQKCLSCPPGLSPISLSERAVNKLTQRQSPIPSWFLDLSMISNYWDVSSRAYHHTAPINALYGLHQALSNVLEEGREELMARHAECQELLISGLETLGLECLVDKDSRLPQLTTILIPDYMDDKDFREQLMAEYKIEIGGGIGELAGQVWRIGLMGNGARPEYVEQLLDAMSRLHLRSFIQIEMQADSAAQPATCLN
ncbi:pyridoxal-phosphate-dependent aminotransferase family protein [Photobacterium sp. TY1-4]|uniref:pyridoxal-phosphate-dependent aminotransferase family protein n=1 Tax=Photobacterium sp. TY1-4 TaxID=2899122 RepID=UPI0021C02469|nr:alanine--glyoxylate aminotransferase family protein [Photobacterium sp. TY1-4]UXI04483.1 alanine--glyoxylate aminotransferase family protein [Photobacterium sp. TY1-4]